MRMSFGRKRLRCCRDDHQQCYRTLDWLFSYQSIECGKLKEVVSAATVSARNSIAHRLLFCQIPRGAENDNDSIVFELDGSVVIEERDISQRL